MRDISPYKIIYIIFVTVLSIVTYKFIYAYPYNFMLSLNILSTVFILLATITYSSFQNSFVDIHIHKTHYNTDKEKDFIEIQIEDQKYRVFKFNLWLYIFILSTMVFSIIHYSIYSDNKLFTKNYEFGMIEKNFLGVNGVFSSITIGLAGYTPFEIAYLLQLKKYFKTPKNILIEE